MDILTRSVEPQSIIVENCELQLADLVRESLGRVPQRSPECCIYRVPVRHRRLNENAYTPQRVSIGPFHYGKVELQDMEMHKLRYLQAFLDRTKLKLEDCIKAIKECEERARRCYEERINFPSEQLAKLFLVDSCFIIEAILRSGSNTRKPVDQINPLNNPEMIFHLRGDMILLENQLPFFVIDGLFRLAFPTVCQNKLLKLSVDYFTDIMLVADIKDRVDLLPPSSEVNHFVDLLRLCLLPSTRRLVTDQSKVALIGNAVELQNAGILNFTEDRINSLLDIDYTRGMLKIPRITLTEHSGRLLRNLMALEQCKNPYDTYIRDYVMFMDRLIDSDKDVDILVHNGIIDSQLSDSSVAAALFNSLGNKADLWVAANYYYGDISREIIAYCDKPWNRWKAALKRDYLSTPWMIASTTAAVILLLLTLIQTICSVISL